MRHAFTLIELVVTIAIIAVLATVAIAALAGVNRYAQQRRTAATLELVQSALKSYCVINGKYPLDPAFQPPTMDQATANGLANNELNASLLANLKHDTGQGNFNAFAAEAVALQPSTGRECLIDAWGRPLQVKLQIGKKNGKDALIAVFVYSAGDDGLDNWSHLQLWLTSTGATWPPPESYQTGLVQTDPTNANCDNLYPSAQ